MAAKGFNTEVAARFRVEAVSRHPRIGKDYNSVNHTYNDSYLNPRSYGIAVDAFPGKSLLIPRGDQQVRPGGDPKEIRDIYLLNAPEGTTGWQFGITGRPAPAFAGEPRPREFAANGNTKLVTLRGLFREDRDDNAWNWRFDVPGPGTYTVTVETMAGTKVLQSRTATLTLRDVLVVSIGDSAASGQGNPDVPGSPAGFDPDISWWEVFVPAVAIYKLTAEAFDWSWEQVKRNVGTISRAGGLSIDMDPKPTWLEPAAYRSLRSGHAHAARLLEDRAQGTVVTFLPFGRTGSTIPDGLIGPRTSSGRPADPWIGNRGQIDEVAGTLGERQIDALLIHIGVNDMQVASTLESLVKGDSQILGSGNPTQARKDAEALALKNLAALPGKLQQLATALSALRVRHVYLTEYPIGLFDDAAGVPQHGCGIFSGPHLNLSKRDAELISSLSSQMNATLEAEAKRLGWFYVGGIAAAFKGHGYCAPDRFFVDASESLAMQGDTEGTIHPNPSGAEAIGECVAKLVKQNTLDVIVADEKQWLEPVLNMMMR